MKTQIVYFHVSIKSVLWLGFQEPQDSLRLVISTATYLFNEHNATQREVIQSDVTKFESLYGSKKHQWSSYSIQQPCKMASIT